MSRAMNTSLHARACDPLETMLTEAFITMASDRGTTLADKALAKLLLDAYGEENAVAIADALPGKIRKMHADRVRASVMWGLGQ